MPKWTATRSKAAAHVALSVVVPADALQRLSAAFLTMFPTVYPQGDGFCLLKAPQAHLVNLDRITGFATVDLVTAVEGFILEDPEVLLFYIDPIICQFAILGVVDPHKWWPVIRANDVVAATMENVCLDAPADTDHGLFRRGFPVQSM